MSFKNKNIVREFPFFTHFICLPFNTQNSRKFILSLQKLIQNQFQRLGFNVQQILKRHSHLLGHLTLFMLTLKRQDVKEKLTQILLKQHQQIMRQIQNLQIKPIGVKYFTRVNKNQKCNELTVIYLQIDEKSQQNLQKIVNRLTKILLDSEIIVPEELKSMRINYNHKNGTFQLQKFHISLFRCKNLMEKQTVIRVFEEFNEQWKKSSHLQIFGQVKTFQNRDKQSLQQKLLIEGKKDIVMQFNSVDVSTMMAFDETQFYEPFIRLPVKIHTKIQNSIQCDL